MLCEPEAEAGITKMLIQPPLALAETPVAVAFPSKVILMPVSLAAKPEPVTVIELPGTPLVLLRVIPAPTVKLTFDAVPEVVIEPYAPTLCEPEAKSGTVTLVFQAPIVFADIPVATVFPSKVTFIPVSLAPKPEPVMVIELPGAPLVLLRVMAALVLKVTVGTAVVSEP
jgi:hypothetical protein